MKDWKMAMVLIAVISALPFVAIISDAADGAEDDEEYMMVYPSVVSVEYDSSQSSDLKVTTDINFDGRVCQYYIYDSKGVIQLHGPSTSSSNYFLLDTTIATAGYLADDSFKLYFDNKTVPYEFDIVKLTFNGNGTSLKSQTVHLSTDSLASYSMPSGFIWNTKSDASGAWISDLTLVDFEDNTATLYAFKSNNIGITIESSTSTVTPGSDAYVIIDLTGNSGIAEIDLRIEYDASVLTLERATAGTVLSMDKVSVKNYPFEPVLKTNETVRTIGNLLSLRFAVADDAALGQYPVVVSVIVSEDAYGKVVPNTVTGCAVTVGEKIRGDLENNGLIDDSDSVVLMKRLANISTGLSDSEFDLNGDGAINALDSLIMMKYLAGMPVSFADSSEEGVSMTISDSDGNDTVSDIHSSETVYINAEGATSVSASSSSGNIAVTKVSDSRYSLVAPASNFTVKFS